MPDSPPNTVNWMLRPGDRVDKYEIVGQIGQGGMSVVWKGYDRLLDQPVAIKQLHVDAGRAGNEEAFRERFRQEAQLQKRVAQQHKHLVRIIDCVEDARGLFIIMEHVDGQSLEQVLARTRGPLDTHLALGIVGAAALGLSHLHREGVIHRDLKPSNILLPARGGLKICDFGLAGLIGDQEHLDVGSVRYMAPECFGEGAVGPKADIYALGLVAYEMLAGREKFEQAFRIVLRDQRNQALRWMKWHTNLRVSAPPLNQLNPAAPPKLAELVTRMTDKDLERRIGSLDEVLAAIRRHFTGAHEEPRAAGAAGPLPEAPEQRTAPLPRRKPLPPVVWVLLSVAAVMVLAVGLGLGLLLQNQARENRAREEVRNQARQRYVEARKLFTDGQYGQALPTFDALAGQWKTDPLGQASLLHARFCQADAAIAEGRFSDAVKLLEETDDLFVKVSEKYRDEKFTRNLIQTQRTTAMARGGLVALQREIEDLMAAGKSAEARAKLRVVKEMALNKTITEQDLAPFAELDRRLEGQERQGQVEQVIAAARQMAQQGQTDQAIAYLNQQRTQLGARDIDDLIRELQQRSSYDRLMANLRTAEGAGRWAEAISLVDRALRLRPNDRALERKLPQLRSKAAYQRGRDLEQAGDPAAAREAYREAAGYDPANREASEAMERLKTTDERDRLLAAADTALAGGKFDLAITLYNKALEMMPDPAVAAKVRQAEARQKLQRGRSLFAAGQYDEARTAFNEVLQIDRGNTEARDELAKLDRIAEYQRHIDKGDQFRKQARYGDARREYAEAQKVLDTPEVKQRLDDAEFEGLVASMRGDVRSGSWSSAAGWLATVRRNYRDRMNTKEIQELAAQIDAHTKDQGKGGKGN